MTLTAAIFAARALPKRVSKWLKVMGPTFSLRMSWSQSIRSASLRE